MRLAWATDVHLNFVDEQGVDAFIGAIEKLGATALILSGDIGEAENADYFLTRIGDGVAIPTYFVLGNHDFYGGTFKETRHKVKKLTAEKPNLFYLSASDPIVSGIDLAIVGHDGWADGRLGDYDESDLVLNDYLLITDFRPIKVTEGSLPLRPKPERLKLMQAQADAAARHLEWQFSGLAASTKHIVVVTHVPPFREACWHNGRISDDRSLPHFASKVVGDMLLREAERRADCQLTVLCGHTHSGGEARITNNLKVITGGAEYGKPTIQRVIEIS